MRLENRAMELLMAVCLGVGLSVACGFRAFVPMLLTSAAAHQGYVELSEGLAWIGSTPALVAFCVAAVVEVGALLQGCAELVQPSSI